MAHKAEKIYSELISLNIIGTYFAFEYDNHVKEMYSNGTVYRKNNSF